MLRRTLLLGAALVALAPLQPARADLTLGIQDDALLLSSEPQAWPLLAPLKPGLVRYTIFWSEAAPARPVAAADPADPAYDWSRSDRMVRETAAIGARNLFTLAYSPGWANGGQDDAVVPTEPLDYGAFCRAVATRYSGAYVPAGATEPLPRVDLYTIWNETNRGQYLMPQGTDGTAGPQAVAELATACIGELKAANPNARAAPMVASRGAEGGLSPLEFLDAYAEAGGPEPDAWAINPYLLGLVPAYLPGERTPDGAITIRNLDRFEKALVARYGKAKPIWLTEFAWRTAPTPRLGNVTPARQAELLRESVRVVAQHEPYVELLIWFLLRDEGADAYWRSGLAFGDWTPKPAYAVFQELAAGGPIVNPAVPPTPKRFAARFEGLHARAVLRARKNHRWQLIVSGGGTLRSEVPLAFERVDVAIANKRFQRGKVDELGRFSFGFKRTIEARNAKAARKLAAKTYGTLRFAYLGTRFYLPARASIKLRVG